jgi:hypothetical protein
MIAPAGVVSLEDYRPVRSEERLRAIVEIAASGLGHGDRRAQETLVAMAVALRDLATREAALALGWDLDGDE